MFTLLIALTLLAPAPDSTAAEAQKPLFSFGVVTDVHYSNRKEPSANRYYRDSKRKLTEAVAAFNTAHVDFVVSLGDLIDNDIESYPDIAPVLAAADAPVHKIAGNHDFPVPFAAARQQAVFRTMGLAEPCFPLVRDGCRLLFLDANDIAVYAHAEGTPSRTEAEATLARLTAEGAANARRYNGALGAAQLEWLVRELRAAEAAGERVICLCHMPALPLPGRYTLWNNLEVAGILSEYPCVKAFLAGHHHPGGYGIYRGVHYLTFRGMVEGTENKFAIVDVYPDKLVVRGFGTEETRTLPDLR